jgi:hypothetical protein
MRYMESLKFITAREGWFVNLIMVAICLIIPAVGQIVLLGYLFEVFDSLRRDPARRDYPLFSWNQFVPYLTRGIWPFIVQIVFQMILGVPSAMIYVCGGILASAVGKDSGAVGVLVFALTIFMLVLIGLVAGILMWGMFIYEGLRQELDVSGLIRFTREFTGKMWKEIVLASLFLWVCGLVLLPLGILACCVGMYVAIAFWVLQHYHLMVQTYDLYLERGGTPVPEKRRREYPSDEALAEPPPPTPRTPPAGASDAFTAEPPPG